MSGYSPVTPAPQGFAPPASQTNDMQPGYNPTIRCPLPPIFQATPDSLRQFYVSNVPQTRLLSAITSGINSGGASGGNVVSSSVINTGGSNPPPAQLVSKQSVVTTTVLGPGQQFVGTLPGVSESFQLLSVTTSIAARVAIYGTSFAQTADLSRGLDQPPPAGTSQDIITDVALDTSPFSWNFQDRVGANNESPQRAQAYVTITNLSGAALPVTVTVLFVPLEA